MTKELKLIMALCDFLNIEVEDISKIIMTDGFEYDGSDISGLNPRLIDRVDVNYKLTKKESTSFVNDPNNPIEKRFKNG